MACFHPLYARRFVFPNGRFSKFEFLRQLEWTRLCGRVNPDDVTLDHIVLNKDHYQYLLLPCGQCFACRMRRGVEWSVRCDRELHTSRNVGSFITLTYNDEHLPTVTDGGEILGNLVKRDLQLFNKRLRKSISPATYRFYGVGEYGSQFGRPHFHQLIFGYDFPDKTPWMRTKKGQLVYRSKILENAWPFGFSSIGEITPESIGYCTKYILKKITGAMQTGWYRGREPEFQIMSRKPGIGGEWIRRYTGDVYVTAGDTVVRDFTFWKNLKVPPPRYFDNILACQSPEKFDIILHGRRDRAVARLVEAPQRLRELKRKEKYALYVASERMKNNG